MAALKVMAGHAFGQPMPQVSFDEALRWGPDVIVAQGTSTDVGPYYLGRGANQQPPPNVKRAFSQLLGISTRLQVPFIWSVGTGGTAGSLEAALQIFREICEEQSYNLKIAAINGEVSKDYLSRIVQRDPDVFSRLLDSDRLPERLSAENIEASEHIVAQTGPEPIMRALEMGVDGVIVGRALDVGLYMAMPLVQGFGKGLAAHLGKTIECGAIPSVALDPGNIPKGAAFDLMLAEIRDGDFSVLPANPELKCTVTSIASHAFYERVNPFKEENPGGSLDLRGVQYEQVDERTVRTWGAEWIDEPYSIKLEGAAIAGYRTICIAGLREPGFIAQLDEILDRARTDLETMVDASSDDYQLVFHCYGRDGVMKAAEPLRDHLPHEVGLVIEVVGKTPELASTVASGARALLMGTKFPGRLSTAGNLALLYSPSEMEVGPAYVFNVWHKMLLDDPCEPFTYRIVETTTNGGTPDTSWRSFD